MNTVELKVETLGDKFKDYRNEVYGNSFSFGPEIYAPNVQFLTFHHSVTEQTAKKDGDWKKEVDYIAKLHVDTRGWAGIGYHFIICSDGTVAYVADLSHGAANVADHNDINFGACMVGDFTKELPTDEQIHSAHLLEEWFVEHMPQYPNLNDYDKSIRGHKDWCNSQTSVNCTECPGASWPNDMKWRIKYDRGYKPVVQTTVPLVVTPIVPERVGVGGTGSDGGGAKGGAGGTPVITATPEPSIVVEPKKTTVEEIPVVDMSNKSEKNNILEVHVANTVEMRHVDYVIAIFKFFIKILTTPIKLW